MLGGRVGEGCLAWDVERLAKRGCWEGRLSGERRSREAEDLEGERVRARVLVVGLGHFQV